MKARDLFALVIRVLGLMGLVHVVHSVTADVFVHYMLLNWPYYVTKFIYLALGLYCFRGAPLLVALAYPDEP